MISPKPGQSMPPVEMPGASSMPNQITTSTAVTTIAGSDSSAGIDIEVTRAPLVSAPMITDSSSAPTRIDAERRVSRAWWPEPAVRR